MTLINEDARVGNTLMQHHTSTETNRRTRAYIRKAARRRGWLPDEMGGITDLALFYLGQLERDDPGLAERVEAVLELDAAERGACAEMGLLRIATRGAVGDGGRGRPVGKKARRTFEDLGRSREEVEDPLLAEEERCHVARRSLLIREALDSLDPRDREILELCFHEDLTVRQVAERTGIARSTIGDRRAGALRRLKASYERLEGEFASF